jgi:hypothetical protein
MMTSIEERELPVVFQQAISIARGLGISYIWIDSLCIIQDSEQDWDIESSRMCDYYERSYLTIATAASPDSGVPFLRQRDEKWWPAKFGIRGKQGEQENVYVQRLPETPEEEGILFTRAWTWQEAALSTRTIYFTPSEVIWECWSEIVPQHYIPDQQVSERIGFSRVLSSLRTGDFGEVDGENDIMNYIWDMWDDLVSMYSSRSLTFATDKPPALSGVAYRVNQRTESRYLAGLWANNLLENLCWAVNDLIESLLFAPPTYIAPSWSWASLTQGVEAQVEKTIGHLESKVSILDADTKVLGVNPFGRVSSGHLVLRGKVVMVELACDEPLRAHSYNLRTPKEKKNKWQFQPDCAIAVEKSIFTKATLSRARNGQKLSRFRVETPCIYLGGLYFSDEPHAKHHYALVLGPSKDEKGSYCRLGLADSRDAHMFKDAPEREIRIL